MKRDELRGRIESILPDDITILDVLYYKKGTAQKVIVIEHQAYRALSDTIYTYQSRSAEEALMDAMARHIKGGDLDMAGDTGLPSANPQLEEL